MRYLKNNFFKLSILLIPLLSSLQGRVPENLVGTDIFKSNTPFNNLNLCYGAELFNARVAQALYTSGDIIEIKKESLGDRMVYKTYFYDDIIAKNELHYSDINPLALLARIIFYQIPGSASMSNFKVSQKFRTKYDQATTIQQWAFLIATAVKKTYEFKRKIVAPNDRQPKNAFVDACLALHNKSLSSLNFTDLVKRCIACADKNNLGAWFPVRLLMAGTYELFGHDQKLIFTFYEQLKKELKLQFYKSKNIQKELEQIIIPGLENIPAPYTAATKSDGHAFQCYRLSKELQDAFEPLTERNVILSTGEKYPDCFEVLVRNIIIKLIIKADHTFNAAVLTGKFKLFFEKYPSMAEQDTQDAYNEWSEFLVTEFKNKLWFSKGYYELEPSLYNALIIINRAFNLNINVLTCYSFLFQKTDKLAKNNLKGIVIAVNEGLKKKLKVPVSTTLIKIEKLGAISDTSGKEIKGEISNTTGVLRFDLGVASHGDLENSYGDYKNSGRKNSIAITDELLHNFPYLVAKLDFNQEGLAPLHLMGFLNPPNIDRAIFQQFDLCMQSKYMAHMIYAAGARQYEPFPDEYESILKRLLGCINWKWLLVEKALKNFDDRNKRKTNIDF